MSLAFRPTLVGDSAFQRASVKEEKMSENTIRDELGKLSVKMVEEKNPTAFRNLVKEMSHLIAVDAMDRLLETCQAKARNE